MNRIDNNASMVTIAQLRRLKMSMEDFRSLPQETADHLIAMLHDWHGDIMQIMSFLTAFYEMAVVDYDERTASMVIGRSLKYIEKIGDDRGMKSRPKGWNGIMDRTADMVAAERRRTEELISELQIERIEKVRERKMI